MKNVLLKIEYDGTDFAGWQRQEGKRTVQGELERVLSALCRTPVVLDGTGRTDAGVHALGQCATFHGEFGIPVARIPQAANDMLAASRFVDSDVRIISAEEVAPDFHARFNACGKTYVYLIYVGTTMPVFMRNRRYHVRKPLDVQAMQAAAQQIAGRHDFAAFMSAGGNPQKTTVRTIYGLTVTTLSGDAPMPPAGAPDTGPAAAGGIMKSGQIAISVTGDGFLYNMVRIIAGTLTDVGLGRIPAGSAGSIVASCDRSRAGHTAPPQGLYMAQVFFTRDDLLKAAAARAPRLWSI